jgi:hypothetical protein
MFADGVVSQIISLRSAPVVGRFVLFKRLNRFASFTCQIFIFSPSCATKPFLRDISFSLFSLVIYTISISFSVLHLRPPSVTSSFW